ncbi:TetR/AcrR family transcriptional regulator [Williamsia sp. CHRR-6]|uniref:TetR/AcrR family transcriptional regulator n=1 Tax=Williamsia sp. CHRR-6 TaxID=2835871 RepID=UPI001BDAB0DB|nr:TetR/AcrR family transcriptional regulator [Williamsia sp. CHRR-6]MBT0565869.1 TetR/AcrR family transcriptional regulator [Williamsia sp. CHRR-6]
MRTRMTTDQRRAQLLSIGAELFASRPHEEVSIEEVAAAAGVSCGLLYRYFPSKRAFFLAVVENESARMLDATTPDTTLDPFDQIRAGVRVYVDYAAAHPDGFRVAHRSALSDPELLGIHEGRGAAHLDHILAGVRSLSEPDAANVIAVTGWLAFVPAAILSWLDTPTITREQLSNLCAHTLWAALGLASPAEHNR